MTLRIYDDLVQGTYEWLEARCGMLTASTIGKLLTPTLRVADNDTSRRIALSLTAERITGHVQGIYQSSDMLRGVLEEPIARDAYAKHRGVEVAEVGFMVRDIDGMRLGYSPDGLVGDDGLIEIKSRLQNVQLRHVLDGRVPPEHMAQVQAGLLVSGREWCDYVSFSGGMALWTVRAKADPDWALALTEALATFEATCADMEARYREATVGLPMTERTPDVEDLVI